MKNIIDIDSITKMHQIMKLKSPDHPLISITLSKDFASDLMVPEGKYRLNL